MSLIKTSIFNEVVKNLKVLTAELNGKEIFKEHSKIIEEVLSNANQPLLIMVMGEFSTGKSTFINALVGKEIAAMNATPTTAVITKLCYGSHDKITVHFKDGNEQNYNVDEFERLTSESDEATGELHNKIDFVERAMNIAVLKKISIIDSPGLNAIKSEHEETTRRFMDNADVVLWLFNVRKAVSRTEIKAMDKLNPRLQPIALVNKIDLLDEEEDDLDELLNSVRRKLKDKVQRVIGISAQMALQGSLKKDKALKEASNIDEFYTTLDKEVLPNRDIYKLHSMMDELGAFLWRFYAELESKETENQKNQEKNYQLYVETKSQLLTISDLVQDSVEPLLDYCEKNQKNATAVFFRGVIYGCGICVDKDTEKSLQLLEEAAIRNDEAAQILLGLEYQKSNQPDKAEYWFKVAAENGSEYAAQLLQKKENDLEVVAATVVATIVNADEMCRKGEEFYNQKNYKEAMKWYEKAADGGNTTAMNNIGDFYCYGNGVVQNFIEAMKWYKKAVKAGDASAMGNVNRIHRYGYDVKQNYIEAMTMEWYKKAADIGDVTAMSNMGWFYEKGYGVAQNYNEAMNWYKKAAEVGHASAMNKVGDFYYHGQGVIQSYTEAMKWYKKAAKAGSAEAMYNVGWLYHQGYGIVQNHNEALKWYKKAADQGNHDAIIKINEFNSKQSKNLGTNKMIHDKKLDNPSDVINAILNSEITAEELAKLASKSNELPPKKQSDSSCFITTAVCNSFNKPDDCYELTMFRNFRDEWLMSQSDGKPLIDEYYDIAPRIVEKIDNLPNAAQVYQSIWNKYLKPCLTCIEKKNYLHCKEIYIAMVNNLRERFYGDVNENNGSSK